MPPSELGKTSEPASREAISSTHTSAAQGLSFQLNRMAATDDDPCAFVAVDNYDQGLHIGGIFIILGCSFLGSLLPIIADRYASGKIPPLVFTCGKLFGSGVIFATGFIHMFPDADQKLTNSCLSSAFTTDYTAYSGLFAMLGALFVMAVQVIASVHLRRMAAKEANSPGASVKVTDINEACLQQGSSAPSATRSHTPPEIGSDAGCNGVHSLVLRDSRTQKHIATYALELGIAIHSVIIGVDLGVSDDSTFPTLCAALAVHQFFEGWGLATIFVESDFKSRWPAVFLVLFYSITTPVGVSIGVGIRNSYNENGSNPLISQGVLDAVSAGILIFDALVNMIMPHFNGPNFRNASPLHMVVHFVFLYLGAGGMAFIGRYA